VYFFPSSHNIESGFPQQGGARPVRKKKHPLVIHFFLFKPTNYAFNITEHVSLTTTPTTPIQCQASTFMRDMYICVFYKSVLGQKGGARIVENCAQIVGFVCVIFSATSVSCSQQRFFFFDKRAVRVSLTTTPTLCVFCVGFSTTILFYSQPNKTRQQGGTHMVDNYTHYTHSSAREVASADAAAGDAAIHCNTCNTLQHTAIHCNTLQYTAKHG